VTVAILFGGLGLFIVWWIVFSWGRVLGQRALRRSRRGESTASMAVSEVHARTRDDARHALDRLASLSKGGSGSRAFGYARSVPHFVFEEMILQTLRERGLKVEPRPRYTADGGSDGAFWLGEDRWLIQARRYRGHVNADHVWTFNALCHRENARGIFIHTGKTPPSARERLSEAERVTVISGKTLLDVFAGAPLKLQAASFARPHKPSDSSSEHDPAEAA